MPTDNVIGLFGLSNQDALSHIREIAQDSSRVAFTNHAKERLEQRGITRKQVIECLLRSRIVEEPFRTPRGNWKLTVEGQSIDDWIRVALCIDSDNNGNYILVITVINT